jgi:hypothetical protein
LFISFHLLDKEVIDDGRLIWLQLLSNEDKRTFYY